MSDHTLFRIILVVILIQKSSAKHECGKLRANSYYDGDMAVGEVLFFPNQALQAAFERSTRDYVSYSWWKGNDTHPIMFKISREKMVIVTDTRFREVGNTLIIRGMNVSDVGKYYIVCSFDGIDGQTDTVELLLPEQLIVDTANQITSLNTTTVSLIAALVALFIGQFVAISIFCFRRRLNSERSRAQRDEAGRLNDRSNELHVSGLSEIINVSDRRVTNISIESHYDKIPYDTQKECDFRFMPTISERRNSLTSPERRSSGEHEYIELTEVIDCQVKKTVHYVHSPVRNHEKKWRRDHDYPSKESGIYKPCKTDSKFVSKPRCSCCIDKTAIYENQPKKHMRMNEELGDYLAMDSFDRDVEQKNYETNMDLNKKGDENITDEYAIEYRKMPFRIQIQKKENNYISLISSRSDITDAGETINAKTSDFVNLDFANKNEENRSTTSCIDLHDPDVPKEDNLTREGEDSEGVVNDEEEEMYMDMDVIRDLSIEASYMNKDAVIKHKRNDQILEYEYDEEDPYMIMEQIPVGCVLDEPRSMTRTEDDVQTSVKYSFDNGNVEIQPCGAEFKSHDYVNCDGTLCYSPVVMRKKKFSLRREPAFEEDVENLYMNMEGRIEEWV